MANVWDLTSRVELDENNTWGNFVHPPASKPNSNLILLSMLQSRSIVSSPSPTTSTYNTPQTSMQHSSKADSSFKTSGDTGNVNSVGQHPGEASPSLRTSKEDVSVGVQMELDQEVARSMQFQEDELSAKILSQGSPGTSPQVHSSESIVAESLQREEAILSSIPVKDNWYGDTGDGANRHSATNANVSSALEVAPIAPISQAVQQTKTAERIPLTPTITANDPGIRISPSGGSSTTSSNVAPNGRSIVCARQGADHLQRGEVAAARKCFERGLSLNDGSYILKLKLHAQLANICMSSSEFPLAIDHIQAQLSIAQEHDRKSEECVALRMLSIAKLNYGIFVADSESLDEFDKVAESGQLFGEALDNCEALIKKAEEYGLNTIGARAYRDKMKVHLVLKNQVEAEEAAEKHLELIRGKGSRRELARAVASCASLRTANGESGDSSWTKPIFEGVQELLWEQAALGEEIGDEYIKGKAYYEISKLLEGAGSWAQWYGPAKARQYLAKAREGYENISPLTQHQKTELEDIKERLVALDADSSCVLQ